MKSLSYLAGIDQHKETSGVSVSCGRGESVDEFQVSHDAVHALDEHLKRNSGGVALALDATGFYD